MEAGRFFEEPEGGMLRSVAAARERQDARVTRGCGKVLVPLLGWIARNGKTGPLSLSFRKQRVAPNPRGNLSLYHADEVDLVESHADARIDRAHEHAIAQFTRPRGWGAQGLAENSAEVVEGRSAPLQMVEVFQFVEVHPYLVEVGLFAFWQRAGVEVFVEQASCPGGESRPGSSVFRHREVGVDLDDEAP